MFEGVAAPQQQHRAAVCDHGKRSNRQAPFAALLVGFASAACSDDLAGIPGMGNMDSQHKSGVEKTHKGPFKPVGQLGTDFSRGV